MATKKRKPTIRGTLLPSRWDESGNIKGVSLHTDDEKEYRVELNVVGKELLGHIHHKVEAIGKVRERLDGSLNISVRRYNTIGETFENEVAQNQMPKSAYSTSKLQGEIQPC